MTLTRKKNLCQYFEDLNTFVRIAKHMDVFECVHKIKRNNIASAEQRVVPNFIEQTRKSKCNHKRRDGDLFAET